MFKMVRIVAVTGFALACFSDAALPQEVLATGECEALKKIVEHTKNDFALLKGNFMATNKWQASLNLPGKRTCYIQRTKRVSYVCESEIMNSGVDALRLRDQRLEALQACFGPVWTKQLMFADSFVGLSHVEAERGIILAVDKDTPLPEYYVRTSIYRMNQLPLEPAVQTPAKVRPAGYCAMLKEMITDSGKKFGRLIEGAERNEFPNRVHWQSNQQLQGWQDCYVHEWNGQDACRYLTCKIGPVAGRKEASSLMGNVVSDVRQCLGSDWRENRIRQASDIVGSRLVSRNNPIIELMPSQSLYSDAWYLDFRLRAEGACQ